MSTTPLYSSGQVQTAPNRWLWAAVGALGATVLALGVALVQMRSAPTPSPTAVAAMPALNAPAAATASLPAPIAVPTIATSNEPVALSKSNQVTTKKIAPKNPPPTPGAPNPANAPPVAAATPLPPPPPRVICAHCGTVTAVTPVQRDGAGSGAGAVAGAVLGGLLGNQVGGGTGKTLATVVGAVGGGYAGNTVEKRMKKETVYHIDLRMEDGSTMRLEHASPLSVGAHVTVANGVITP